MHLLKLRLIIVALVAASATAFAQPPSSAEPPASLFLEDLTSPELAAAIRAGKTTIIVPIGGTEQNGPHMALGKHNVRVKALAERIARELGNALVAPVMAYVPEGGVNPPTGHMRFPGTITMPADVYRESARIRGAQLQARRIPRHRVPGRSRRLPEGQRDRGRAAQSRMGGARRCACTRSANTTARNGLASRKR